MAATLQSLFPQQRPTPEDYNVFPCYAEFSAPLVMGKYVFSEKITPAVEFGKLLQGQIGVIAGVMISANCTPAQFAEGVDKPLKLQVLHSGNFTPVNMAPFPFTEFSQGDNFQLQWKITASSMQQEENFNLAISGEVNQLSGMTSNELVLRVTFNFLKIAESKLK